tara:strand:- start:471 stop:1541 length:1071 start_codon:yes stop_codon:yes gene_type:complete
MASARARMGALRRRIGSRQSKTNLASNIFSTAGVLSAFGAGQAKKADTAWGEYEAGYEALGGEGFERPKFGQKGYFKGPEGTVRINRPDVYSDKPPTEWGQGREIISKGGAPMEYDMEQIRKAGSFLGSDAAAILDEGARKKYLQRTVQGTEITPQVPVMKHKRPTYDEMMNTTSGGDSPFVDPSTQPKYGSGKRSGNDSIGVFSGDELYDWDDDMADSSWKSGGEQISAYEMQKNKDSIMKQFNSKPDETMWSKAGKGLKGIGDYGQAVVGTAAYRLGQSTGFTGDGGGTGVKTGVSQIPDMLNIGTPQNTYTDEQRKPYLENPKNTWFDTWKKNLSKQIKEGGQDTTWYNQDGR